MELPDCTADIANTYGIPVAVIEAVHRVEGGRPGLEVANHNGTEDLGPMQINTWWLSEDCPLQLQRYGVTRAELVHNPCTNIAVGTWILRMNLDSHRGDWIAALSAYNTGKGNSQTGQRYAKRVLEHLR